MIEEEDPEGIDIGEQLGLVTIVCPIHAIARREASAADDPLSIKYFVTLTLTFPDTSGWTAKIWHEPRHMKLLALLNDCLRQRRICFPQGCGPH